MSATLFLQLYVRCVCCGCMSQEVIGVIFGGTLGHALCTSLAVLGGRCIAQHISIKTGSVFIDTNNKRPCFASFILHAITSVCIEKKI